MPNSAVQVQAMNDNVVLTGSVSSALESTRAADLAARFAGDPKKVVNMLTVAGGQQVMLKVRIAEMDRSIAKQFGVNLSAAATVGGVPVIAATQQSLWPAGQRAQQPVRCADRRNLRCRLRADDHRHNHDHGDQQCQQQPGHSGTGSGQWHYHHQQRRQLHGAQQCPGHPQCAGTGRPGAYAGRAQPDRGDRRNREVPGRRRIPRARAARPAGQHLRRVQAVRRRPVLHARGAVSPAASSCSSPPRSANSPTPARSRSRAPTGSRRTRP